MASSSTSPKKPRNRPPKTRPAATSTISQPVVDEISQNDYLSAFSPDSQFFALLSLAVDKHRLRVYDVGTGHSVAEYLVDGARVTVLNWVSFSTDEKKSEPSPTKKRKKRDVVEKPTLDGPSSDILAVALGLSDGSCRLFSPTLRRVLRTLTHASSTASILAIASSQTLEHKNIIWTSATDGSVISWDANKNEIVGIWKDSDHSSFSALITRLSPDDTFPQQLLLGRHTLRLISLSPDSTINSTPNYQSKNICSFTGHATTITQLCWDNSLFPPSRFFSSAVEDRFINVWDTNHAVSGEGKLVASISLDSNVRQVHSHPRSGRHIVLALSNSGRITVTTLPAELDTPLENKKSIKQKVLTIEPQSTISLQLESGKSGLKTVATSFSKKEGRLLVASLISGVKPVFDEAQYLDDSGEFIPEVIIKHESAGLAKTLNGHSAPNARYVEHAQLTVTSGDRLPDDVNMDDSLQLEGDLDVGLAELSLGQRLTAASGANPKQGNTSSDSDLDEDKPTNAKRKSGAKSSSAVPVQSLARTLIQALHSSDSGLLEICLAHSDETLIRNTVKKLPPQLVVPLLNACVERLGRGSRAANMKGRGGGASSQRGMSLIKWIKATLTVQSGHLLTIPNMVARLSNLHSTLTTRLTLQERLLSLSGRLDLVLSQVEMRSSAAPAQVAAVEKVKGLPAAPRAPQRYVEGESSDEEIDAEQDDEDGSVEDVELGGASDDESLRSDNEEDFEETDDSDDDEEDSGFNGFIDDEAEEDSGEDDSDDEEE